MDPVTDVVTWALTAALTALALALVWHGLDWLLLVAGCRWTLAELIDPRRRPEPMRRPRRGRARRCEAPPPGPRTHANRGPTGPPTTTTTVLPRPRNPHRHEVGRATPDRAQESIPR